MPAITEIHCWIATYADGHEEIILLQGDSYLECMIALGNAALTYYGEIGDYHTFRAWQHWTVEWLLLANEGWRDDQG